jgi:hypothetical protein
MEFYIKNKPVTLFESFSVDHIKLEGHVLKQYKAKVKIKVIVRKSPLVTDAPIMKVQGQVNRDRNNYYIDADLPSSVDLPDKPYDWRLGVNLLEYAYTLEYLSTPLKVFEYDESEVDEGVAPGFHFDFAGHKSHAPFMPLAEVFPLARAFALKVAGVVQEALLVELERLRVESDIITASRFSLLE